MDARPIGMFDSGFGGLSVLRALMEQLPYESVHYVSDSARCPYGPQPSSHILAYSREITQFLIHQGCKMIVVACNTATASAIHTLRQEFDIPFVGMEPALKPAAKASQTGTIGILATHGTFHGAHFQRTKERYAHEVQVVSRVGNGLVELVESGDLDSPTARQLVGGYIQDLLAQHCDQIVLGCTHYPFLRPIMDPIVAGKAQIIDPAPAVARQVGRILQDQSLQSPQQEPLYQFFSSGSLFQMQELIPILLPEMAQKPHRLAEWIPTPM
ncbi:glutamate racemase [Pontibacter sp. G13]|uniref:glutamate racemase n=1 Tax=Pontibacter sp. G13 TaxID=3074898 RepID=UPI0028898C14|nr:glutamate racemase [Pontibacter sp. G13]WNJ20922.1 glutamate racemase [Pontibacter sp. G13]